MGCFEGFSYRIWFGLGVGISFFKEGMFGFLSVGWGGIN